MIIDYNPITGESVSFEYDHANDEIRIGHHQDCTNIIEENKYQRLHSDAKAQIKNDWVKYASVPNILILKWRQEHGVDFFNPDHWPKVMELINSRDYAYGVKCTELHHDR